MTKQNKNEATPDKNQSETEIQIPLAELIKNRRNKVLELASQGIDAYPYKYDRSHLVSEALAKFDELAESETPIRLAGRIMLKRKMGKSIFADLRDSSDRIQVYVKLNNVGAEAFELFNSIDLGDIIGCEGALFVTRTGEKTLAITTFELLTKALHPLPDKHAGLTDVETRYRRRYAG